MASPRTGQLILKRCQILLIFFMINDVDKKRCVINSSLDLSSDHTPIILNLHTSAQLIEKSAKLYNRKTNWQMFRNVLDENIKFNISLKNDSELELELMNLIQ